MQLADIDVEFPPGDVTFEMSNLSPRETGLDFAVFVSPAFWRGEADGRRWRRMRRG